MNTRREFLQESAGGALAALGVVPPLFPPSSSSAPDAGSDIGSLYPFVQSQAVDGRVPALLPAERVQRRAGVEGEGARPAAGSAALRAARVRSEGTRALERVDRGDYVQEKVVFNTTPDIRVPAFVLVPKKARLPAPAIVALHDHGGFYLWGREKLVERTDEHPSLTDFKRQLYARPQHRERAGARRVRRGRDRHVLLGRAPDAAGGRRPGLARAAREHHRGAHRRLQPPRRRLRAARRSYHLSAGFTWPGVMFWDDIRTVDYLVSRPEVDPTRIGCVGLVGRAVRSLHLAALDDRIKAAVVVGWMTSFPAQLERHIRNTIGHTKLVPGLYRHLDYPDVASLAMPTPLLVINGSKDQLFEPAGVRASFDKLAACYKKAGVPELVRDAPLRHTARVQPRDAARGLELPGAASRPFGMSHIAAERLVNQQLERPRLATLPELVRWMGAVQAQDYRGGLWALGLRLAGADARAIETAIAARQVVRTWPMRGTLHFVPAEDARWMLKLLAERVVAGSAGRYRTLELDGAAFARSARVLVRALEGGRSLTRPEVYQALERAGVSPAGQRGIHVIGHLSQQGLICHGPRRERQPTFVLLEEWIRESASPTREEALVMLATRYFSSHGPATLADFTWWSGLRVKEAQEAIATAGRRLSKETRDGRSWWAGARAPARSRRRGAAVLLPPWDEYIVAYRDRDAAVGHLSNHASERLKTVGSSLVVIDGRVRGAWKITARAKAARFVAEYWTAVTGAERRAVREAALRYGRFFGVELET